MEENRVKSQYMARYCFNNLATSSPACNKRYVSGESVGLEIAMLAAPERIAAILRNIDMMRCFGRATVTERFLMI